MTDGKTKSRRFSRYSSSGSDTISKQPKKTLKESGKKSKMKRSKAEIPPRFAKKNLLIEAEKKTSTDKKTAGNPDKNQQPITAMSEKEMLELVNQVFDNFSGKSSSQKATISIEALPDSKHEKTFDPEKSVVKAVECTSVKKTETNQTEKEHFFDQNSIKIDYEQLLHKSVMEEGNGAASISPKKETEEVDQKKLSASFKLESECLTELRLNEETKSQDFAIKPRICQEPLEMRACKL